MFFCDSKFRACKLIRQTIPMLISYIVLFFLLLIWFFYNISSTYYKTQKIISGPNFLPGVGAPQRFSAPGLAVPKTATEEGHVIFINSKAWFNAGNHILLKRSTTMLTCYHQISNPQGFTHQSRAWL